MWHHGCIVCQAPPPEAVMSHKKAEKFHNLTKCYRCGTDYHGSCSDGAKRGCGFGDCTWPKCVLNWQEVAKAKKVIKKADKELETLLKRK